MEVSTFKVPGFKGSQSRHKDQDIGNHQLRFMERAKESLKMPSKVEIDNQDDGLFTEEDKDKKLREEVRKRDSVAVSQHIEAKKQRLAMNRNTLADLYPEDGHQHINQYANNGGMGDHFHDSNLTPKVRLPTVEKIKFDSVEGGVQDNKIDIREAGQDADKVKKIKF
jgi:hypothetical protein